MKRINHALIMAAGRGKRLMPLTAVIPKGMAPYLGSTLIAEGIRKIRPYIKSLDITVGYKGPKLAEHVLELGVNSVFNTEGNGNAWWIYNTLLKHLDEPMFVLTCDNVIELDFWQLEREYYHYRQPACMVVPVEPVPGLQGDYILQENNVITKLSRHQTSDQYCSGIQVINPAKINRLTHPVDDFYSVWQQLIAQGQLYSSDVYPKRWFTVDTFDQLCKLNEDDVEDQNALASLERFDSDRE
jgi:NDP-sugar pyrophosphorylase family protein